MSFTPGVGDAMEVAQIGNDIRNGNYGTATLAAALTVLPGNASKWLPRSKTNSLITNGKYNIDNIKEAVIGGSNSAKVYMNSQTYKNAVSHDIELAKRAFNVDINPVIDGRYVDVPVLIHIDRNNFLPDNAAGGTIMNPMTNDPIDDEILYTLNHHKNVNDLAGTIFHERLHHGRYKTVDPKGNTIFTNSSQYQPTLDFYKWKLKHLFKPEIEIPEHLKDHYNYLTSVEIPHNEGATNVLELGFLGNFRKSQGYPGAVELQKMLNEVRVANPNHQYTIDLLNMKKPKRVWEALTGQYEVGGKLTNNDYIEKIKKFLLWRTVGPEEFTYINNFKVNE